MVMEDVTRMQPYLDRLVVHFETADFIANDPVSLPHGFDDPRDQEVIGLFAALLAWGRRETVLRKMLELCDRMHFQPYRFVREFDPDRDSDRLKGFKHRTFQPGDAFWLINNLGRLLRRFDTVEDIFVHHLTPGDGEVGPAIQGFSEAVMTAHPQTPSRLQKHLARPDTGSACKRLNMYLRWMVRPGPVDLGIWRRISTDQLLLPLDVHSGRQARKLGLLERTYDDWRACIELTEKCRHFSPDDPARYDFALFGLGMYGDPTDGPR